LCTCPAYIAPVFRLCLGRAKIRQQKSQLTGLAGFSFGVVLG
jgi:hypothetical protein